MDQSTTENAIQTDARVRPWFDALNTRLTLGLAALLGVQILAAIGLGTVGRGALEPVALNEPLLSFDPQEIGGIRIQGTDDAPLVLTRGDSAWSIKPLGDFPADGAKVDAMLDTLAGLKRPLPLGTSPQSLERHKVADDAFERRVILESGGEPVATLILGDSPGFRRVFGRSAGDASVYDLELPLFEVSDRADDWLARDDLRLDRTRMERISSGGWTLVKGADGWQVEGAQTPADRGAVDDLLARIGNLSYRAVLGTQDSADYGQESPVLELEITLSDGTQRGYRVSQAKDTQDYVLKASDRPWYFKLSEFDLEGILGLDPANLSLPAADPIGASETHEAPATPEGEETAGEGGETGASAEDAASPQSVGPSPTE